MLDYIDKLEELDTSKLSLYRPRIPCKQCIPEMMLSQTVTEVKLHLPMHRSRRTADSRYQRQSANNGKEEKNGFNPL